jgi:hypothetical protein
VPVTAHNAYDPERLRLNRPNASRRRVHRFGGTSRSTLHGLSTCFTTRVVPPCQGDGTRLIATLNVQGEQARLAPPKKMPLSNLCSRQIITRVRKTAQLTSLELSLFRPSRPAFAPRTRHACTERDTSRPRRRGLAVAGITCLEWRIGLGADCASCGLEASTSRDARFPGT